MLSKARGPHRFDQIQICPSPHDVLLIFLCSTDSFENGNFPVAFAGSGELDREMALDVRHVIFPEQRFMCKYAGKQAGLGKSPMPNPTTARDKL